MLYNNVKRIIQGDIVHCPEFGKLEILRNGYIVVRENGIIDGVYREGELEVGPFDTITSYRGHLILQGMHDMHMHPPQHPMMGLGLDLPLLDWLNEYTYPQEIRLSQKVYADHCYASFIRELKRSGTTRLAAFGTIHIDATTNLMWKLEEAGFQGIVGKVNMDRNSHPSLQEDTEQSIKDTARFIEGSWCFHNMEPAITPRFTPTCSKHLMKHLGTLAGMHDLYIQSHLSESVSEGRWVDKLEPWSHGYWETYEAHGLWNKKTLMAHCVYTDDIEAEEMASAGVTAVHCPTSNTNLSSGMCNVRKLLQKGVNVTLGSDIGAGHTLNMFDVMAAAIQVSKLVSMRDGTRDLSPAEVYYMATSAAQKYFGEQPGFTKGNKLHAIVVDDMLLPDTSFLTPEERLQRLMYTRDPEWLVASFAGPNVIYQREF